MMSLSAIALTSLLVLTADKVPTPPFLANCFLLGGAPASGPCRVLTAEDSEEINRQIELEKRCYFLYEKWAVRRVLEDDPECIDFQPR